MEKKGFYRECECTVCGKEGMCKFWGGPVLSVRADRMQCQSRTACMPEWFPSERFVKDIMEDIKKCPKIKHFQALPQYTYSVIFHALHIVLYQTDNFVIHAFPTLLAVME